MRIMKKNTIVITSIFEPTEAVKKFARLKDFDLIVVGDKKSPEIWNCDDVHFLSINDQKKLEFDLAKVLPYNHYCRKMLGYLVSIKSGATSIFDTDDDNIPHADWSFPEFNGQYDHIDNNKGFINIYQTFTDQFIWPRGLPLRLIKEEFKLERCTTTRDSNVGVWQGLADEDPDVDAIYRLVNNTPCYFKKRDPIVLGVNTISPFNSQNTLIRKELFALLYLPTYVTFRFTDILRGLVAQPIMWLYGYKLGFTKATVTQKRNPHDFMVDFESEIPMYINSELVIELVTEAIEETESIENNLFSAYKALCDKGIVTEMELVTLRAWIDDLGRLK